MVENNFFVLSYKGQINKLFPKYIKNVKNLFIG